jgi:hypothetical protein
MSRLMIGLAVLGLSFASQAEAQSRGRPRRAIPPRPAVFEVTGARVDDTGGRNVWIKGRVRNVSTDLAPPNVIVTVVFEDANGRYVGDAKGLLTPISIGPGESATFEAVGDRCDFARYEIGFSVAAGPAIPTRGQTRGLRPRPGAVEAETPALRLPKNPFGLKRWALKVGKPSALVAMTDVDREGGIQLFKDEEAFLDFDAILQAEPEEARAKLAEFYLSDRGGLAPVGRKVFVKEFISLPDSQLGWVYSVRLVGGPSDGTSWIVISGNVDPRGLVEAKEVPGYDGGFFPEAGPSSGAEKPAAGGPPDPAGEKEADQLWRLAGASKGPATPAAPSGTTRSW